MATLALEIVARNQAQAALNQLKGGIADVGRQAQSVSDKMRNMGSSLQGIGSKMTAGLTLPILGGAAAALKLAGDFEQTQIALTTMLGDAGKAEALFNEMREFSASTPFEFPQIAEAGKMLLAFGIDSEKVIPKLKSLGDIASGVGIPVSDLTLIYGQASVAGRVMTGDLNQLVGRGVPILSALAKVMGVNEAQVRKLAEEGKVSFADFDKAITGLTENGGQFAGMMDAQSQSLLGLFSTFKDNITLTLADVGKVLIETFDLKGKLTGLNEFLGGISEKIASFAKNNPGMFKFMAIVAALAAAAGPLAVGLGWVMTQLAALGPIVSALAPVFAALTGPIGLVALAIGALVYFDIGGLGTRLKALASAFGSLWNYLVLVVQDGDYLNDFLADLPTWMQPAVEAVGHFIAGLQSIPEYLQLVLEDGDYLNDFLADMPTWMQPAVEWMGRFALGAQSLINYFSLVAEDGDYLNDFLADLPTWMQPAVESIGHFIAGLQSLPEYLQLVVEDGDYLNDFLADMPTWMQPAVEWLGKLTAGAVELASGSDFANLKTTVTESFGDIWQSVKDFFSGDISFSGMASAVEEGFGKIKDAIGEFFGGSDFGAFLETIEWSEFIEKLTWENIITGITDWATYIASLEWVSFVPNLAWADILPVPVWNAYVNSLSWLDFISKMTWTDYVTVLSSWSEFLDPLVWADILPVPVWNAYVEVMKWIDFISIMSWSDYVTVLSAWSDYITSLPWGDYITFLSDWGTYIKELVWSAILPTLTSWGTYIANIDWTAFVVQLLDWATWVPALAWNGFIALVDWATYIFTLDWNTSVPTVDWASYITTLASWGTYIKNLPWKEFVTATLDWAAYVGTLTWTAFVSKLNWPSEATTFAWSGWISKLSWPDVSFKWSDWVPKVRWPDLSFSWADFVPKVEIPEFPGWGSLWNYLTGSEDTGAAQNAIGTMNWRGGPTVVGETGPEIIIPPRGSRILSNRESMAFAGDAASVTVNVTATITDTLDINQLAYQIADIITRRQGRR